MNIDSFKSESGWYHDANGCAYEDAESFIQTAVMGHCGCGQPELSLQYIRDVLRLFATLDALDPFADKERWEKARVDREAFFGSPGERETMYYLLARVELTEHGGAVPGWLTQRGRELLADLEELYPADAPEGANETT